MSWAAALAPHYAGLKMAHIGLVAASGTLFALRGAAVLARARWPLRPAWRMLSVVIDVLLLTAGVTLATVAHVDPREHPWLATKLALLVLYVGLGTLALKRARTPGLRALSLAAALAVYLFMVGVALHHHPAGVLAGLLP